MTYSRFDLADFIARVEARPVERSVLRQALIRGLKDYSEAVYGYDRYGAEAIIHLSDRLSEPYILGFGVLRILRSRRLRVEVKAAASLAAIEAIAYGSDSGLPYGLFEILQFLRASGRCEPEDLRYALVASAGQYNPFFGTSRLSRLSFATGLFGDDEFPPEERAFWGHSLIARHQDQPGARDLIDALLAERSIPGPVRAELARAWLNFRQPALSLTVPLSNNDFRSRFVAQHMGFWIAHSPSWPSHHMVRSGLVWLARLTDDANDLARRYISYRETYTDQLLAGVADIISEHHGSMPIEDLRQLIDLGSHITSSTAARRRFYQLGAALLGSSYLAEASKDNAESIRRWAGDMARTR